MLACLSLGALYATARVALAPRDPANGVAVIYAPWTSPEAAVARAADGGARFVRFGGFSFVAVMAPDAADYSSRVLNAGAWLVVDPKILAACLSGLNSAARSS